MDKLVIGVWQGVCADGDLAANLDKTARVIDRAGQAGCDFLCLPEQFLSGYGCAEFAQNASMTLDDPRLLALAAHAAERDVTTLVGLIEKRGDRCANTQVVLDGGLVAGHYTKTMLIGGDRKLMGFFDDELPVFGARGVCFGFVVRQLDMWDWVPRATVLEVRYEGDGMYGSYLQSGANMVHFPRSKDMQIIIVDDAAFASASYKSNWNTAISGEKARTVPYAKKLVDALMPWFKGLKPRITTPTGPPAKPAG